MAFAEFSLKDKLIQPFQLNNQDMQVFISDYAKIVKKPLLVDKKTIKGNVNFSIVKPITLDDFNKMFVTVLSSQGITVIEDEAFLRVISERDIRYTSAKFYTSDSYPNNDQYILVKHDLKNPLANEITRNMRPFLSRYARIISFNDGHTIILSEKGNNITRIIEIIDNLDNKFNLKYFISDYQARKKRDANWEKKVDIEILKMEKKMLKKEILELKTSTKHSGKAGRL
jgi:type II secretory pathway component GspD/PulD (secretin)